MVQDIFLTETAEFADVVLPASAYLEKLGTYTNTDRRVQVGRPALDTPGEARFDWEIICDISNRMGYPMEYRGPEEVFAEFAAVTDSYHHFTYDNLGSTGKLWPNATPETDDGPVVLFSEGLPHRRRAGEVRPRRLGGGQGAAGRGLPLRPEHRPPARALAHRVDDPAGEGARLDPTRGVRRSPRRGRPATRSVRGRRDPHLEPPWDHHGAGEDQRARDPRGVFLPFTSGKPPRTC